jgi:hypothetical protein
LLFHQNHLLYNPAGYLAYSVLHALGINLRALYLLQIINAMLAAASVFVFFRIVAKMTHSRYAAAVCSVGLVYRRSGGSLRPTPMRTSRLCSFCWYARIAFLA